MSGHIQYSDTMHEGAAVPLRRAISSAISQRGATLDRLTAQRPTLVVFLRHVGCAFCREALDDLRRQRRVIENRGVRIAIVHLSDPMQATILLARYGLDDLHRFHDPACRLYRAFGLSRGRLLQLLGPKVWWRAGWAIIVRRLGFGRVSGDAFRMNGAFLVSRARLLAEYRANSAADRIDYERVASAVEATAGF